LASSSEKPIHRAEYLIVDLSLANHYWVDRPLRGRW
jgi:hypothetical protein